MHELEARIVNSALWAAYGDALGFISELTDSRGLRKRLAGAPELVEVVSWTKRVGGKFGADVSFPAGCYSDDTQLRLATSRTIRGNGVFDVEAFTKVELPIWLSYQLGGGRGTKAAATSLTRRSNSWLKNFFDKPTRYVDSGGNGAAMRIQPHVWASAPEFKHDSYTRDVIRNSITTHGHPRGFLGAVLHARLLAETLRTGMIPSPGMWPSLVRSLASVPQLITADNQLATFWLPAWEKAAGVRMEQAVAQVSSECEADVLHLMLLVEGRNWNYQRLLDSIDMFSPEHRGSGTRSVLAALALAWQFRNQPIDGIREAAQMLGSDTDTIATLAGALLGAASTVSPPNPIMDAQYIREEAIRLSRIHSSEAKSFAYPNLLRWTPPSSATHALGTLEGAPALAGLGKAEILGMPFRSAGKTSVLWQWVRLRFGQTVLVQRKETLPELHPSALPNYSGSPPRYQRVTPPQEELFASDIQGRKQTTTREPRASVFEGQGARPRISIDEATTRVLRSNFDPEVLGEMFLSVAQGEMSVEFACGFAAIITKARMARLARQSTSNPEQERVHLAHEGK